MNRKIIALSSVVLILALGFLYIQQGNLMAGDKNKSCCMNKNTQKTSNDAPGIKAGGEKFASYEFSTDKACCEEMRSSMQKELLGISGVKEVKFSQTCTASKMTMVSVLYDAGATNESGIAASLKEKNIDCPQMPGCDKEGCSKNKSGSNMQQQCPKGGCDMKNKKTNGKDI